MVSGFAEALLEILRLVLQKFLDLSWPITVILGTLTAGTAVFAAIQPQKFSDFRASMKASAGKSVGWLVAGLLVVVGFMVAGTIEPVASDYLSQISSREYVNESAGEGGPISQSPPYFAVLNKKVLTSRVYVDGKLPGESADRMLREIRMAVASRLANGQDSDVKVTPEGEKFRIEGSTELLTEERFSFESSKISVKVDPLNKAGAKSNGFHVKYDSEFSWVNEASGESEGRFMISLPGGWSTYRNLKATVNGQSFDSTDEGGNLRWEGPMKQGEKFTAKVSWETDASGTFTLVPGTGMRKTKSALVEIDAPSSIKFSKSSLSPTKTEGTKRIWNLDNIVSGQTIAFAVPFERERREVQSKAFFLAPYSFLLLGVCLMIAMRKDFSIGRFSLVAAFFMAALGLPIAFISSGGMSLWLTFGCLVAAGVGWLLLRSRGAVIVLCAGAVASAGFFGGLSMFVAIAAALIALGTAVIRNYEELSQIVRPSQ